MTYIFNTRPNSYFAGQDLRIEDTETHNIILVNLKDGMWAVNVKDDGTHGPSLPDDVRNAQECLTDNTIERLYDEGKEDFWRTVDDFAQERGFEKTYQAGRSGGWMAIPGTEDWDPADIFKWGEDANVRSFLSLAFATEEVVEGARSYYFDRVRETMQELQIELSEYADHVGADIRSLDGDIAQVTKLEIVHGQAALRTDGGWFSIAKEATLIRRADGNVPARITADPIMEQVFRIIEARGLPEDQINAFLDDEEGNEPARLYEDYIGPAINELEHRMER